MLSTATANTIAAKAAIAVTTTAVMSMPLTMKTSPTWTRAEGPKYNTDKNT